MISRGQRVQKEGAGNKDIFLLKREATFSKKGWEQTEAMADMIGSVIYHFYFHL